MVIEESINSAYESIRSNLLRSLLTALAIIIGTAAVISMIAIGSTAQNEIQKSMDSLSKSMDFQHLSEYIYFSKSSPAKTSRRILMILGARDYDVKADDLCFHEHLKSFNSTDASSSYSGRRGHAEKWTPFIYVFVY